MGLRNYKIMSFVLNDPAYANPPIVCCACLHVTLVNVEMNNADIWCDVYHGEQQLSI